MKKNRVVLKDRKVKNSHKAERRQTSAGKERAEGMRQFKVAGRPTEEQFVLVYGKKGSADDLGPASSCRGAR